MSSTPPVKDTYACDANGCQVKEETSIKEVAVTAGPLEIDAGKSSQEEEKKDQCEVLKGIGGSVTCSTSACTTGAGIKDDLSTEFIPWFETADSLKFYFKEQETQTDEQDDAGKQDKVDELEAKHFKEQATQTDEHDDAGRPDKADKIETKHVKEQETQTDEQSSSVDDAGRNAKNGSYSHAASLVGIVLSIILLIAFSTFIAVFIPVIFFSAAIIVRRVVFACFVAAFVLNCYNETRIDKKAADNKSRLLKISFVVLGAFVFVVVVFLYPVVAVEISVGFACSRASIVVATEQTSKSIVRLKIKRKTCLKEEDNNISLYTVILGIICMACLFIFCLTYSPTTAAYLIIFVYLSCIFVLLFWLILLVAMMADDPSDIVCLLLFEFCGIGSGDVDDFFPDVLDIEPVSNNYLYLISLLTGIVPVIIFIVALVPNFMNYAKIIVSAAVAIAVVAAYYDLNPSERHLEIVVCIEQWPDVQQILENRYALENTRKAEFERSTSETNAVGVGEKTQQRSTDPAASQCLNNIQGDGNKVVSVPPGYQGNLTVHFS